MTFIPGRQLCRGFFADCVRPLLEKQFPNLRYSAGLLGYGSDVLGFDDEVSTDHMWGPRFYLFLEPEDLWQKDALLAAFSHGFPRTYRGYSVNFSTPDPADHGVRHAEECTEGPVSPLVWIQTLEEYLGDELGLSDFSALTAADWLSFSEHRLLSFTKADWYVDELHLAGRLQALSYYPDVVWRYLLASNWSLLAEEQAFCRRCGDVGDELGSRLVAARIAERLMHLGFLYCRQYAPYSKWFGTAFQKLPLPAELGEALRRALGADSLDEREQALVRAEGLVAAIHNQTGLTPPVNTRVETYFDRKILTIHPDRIAGALEATLQDTELAGIPLIGTLSEVENFTVISNHAVHRRRVLGLYRQEERP